MSDAIITVDNLGKRYRIAHQGQRQRYVALRDVIAEKAKSFFQKLKSGKQTAEINNAEGHNQFPLSPSPLSAFKPAPAAQEDFWALKDVSFEVNRGEVVGIIGRNGAGKSTLLKILSRITEPTEGRVTLRGRVASLLEVGTGFHPELTGRENIFLNGAILGMRRNEIKQKFDEIVAFAEVEKFLDTPVKRYSSGMYVRLAFAVAAHLEPEILIVDEVLAVGDAQFQKKCLGKMGEVAKGGRTVLIVTHQLGILNDLATSGLLLNLGTVEMAGSVSQVIATYLKSSFETDTRAKSGNRIRGIVVLANNQPTDGLVSFGNDIVIKLHLCRPKLKVWGLNIEITTEEGRRLFLFSTQPHDGFAIPDRDEISLSLDIPQFSAPPGTYSINIDITEPSVRIVERYDVVKQISVVPMVIGGVWAYTKVFGSYFPPHRWSVSG
jgi:lipopolysaccharide transport system ATP-binding protein